jgi:RND family efflux transporter MFP subunit
MTEETPHPQPALPGPPEPLLLPPPHRRHRLLWLALMIVVVVVIIAIGLTWSQREKNQEPPPAVPTVAVEKIGRENLYKEETIPAEFRPYVEAELHAKVSGYLDKINVDFGDKVKAGQLLAVLEVPELKDELNASIAAKQKSEADYTNSHLIYTRLVDVNREHPNLVAQQDIDNAQAKDSAALAGVAAAKADVGKYETFFGYTQITAPLDGVITHRYADPGALIQAGTSSDVEARALLRVSDNYRLRLDFPVSVEYVQDIRLGDAVEVRVESFGNETFTGTVTRFTREVNEDTRTMMTEIEVPNPDLKIIPGMYATVVLKVEERPNVLAIPMQAVAPGENPTAYVINDKNEIEERPIKLGLDTPSEYEVLSGLNEGDLVLVGSRAMVKTGEKVEPKLIEPMAQQ